jgi:integrase
VIALLDAIVDRGSPIAANRTLAVIRRMFGWALSRDIVPVSPCVAVKAPAKENRRDRVLSADEIAFLWQALDTPNLAISPAIREALKLQLVTAQRKGEVIGAEWSEFDLDERVWTIPAGKAKNGMQHRVPLSPLALAVLDEIEAATSQLPASGQGGPPRWLFASPRAGRPITGPAVDHAMRGNRDALGAGEATPHDLRRTAASHVTSIGISRLVVSKILNHAEPGVTAVYDRHSYDAEKRAALAAWGHDSKRSSAPARSGLMSRGCVLSRRSRNGVLDRKGAAAVQIPPPTTSETPTIPDWVPPVEYLNDLGGLLGEPIKFIERDIRLIANSLPSEADPKRIEMLPLLLREWARLELRMHLARKPLPLLAQQRRRLKKVTKRAAKLIEALDELEGLDRWELVAQLGIAEGLGLLTVYRNEQNKQRVDEWRGLTATIAAATAAPTSKPGKGQPRNIVAQLVLRRRRFWLGVAA